MLFSSKLNGMLRKDYKSKGNTELDNEVRLLKLDNANLKNQVVGLKNIVARFEEGENLVKSESNQVDYKDKFEKFLKHFEDQLEVKDGQVIDPYAGVRPILICNLS